MPSKRSGIAAFLAAALAAGALVAQTSTPPPGPGEKRAPGVTAAVEVEILNLDLLVTDRKDRPVYDLKPEELVVKISGKPQAIEYFDRPTAPVPRGDQDGEIVYAGTHVPFARTGRVQQHVVFWVDLEELPAAGIAAVADTLGEILPSLPGAPRAGLVAHFDLSNELAWEEASYAAVTEALPGLQQIAQQEEETSQFAGRGAPRAPHVPRNYERRLAFQEQILRSPAPGEVDAFLTGERERVKQKVAELRAVCEKLAELEGSRHLVMITPGLESKPGYNFLQSLDRGNARGRTAAREPGSRPDTMSVPAWADLRTGSLQLFDLSEFRTWLASSGVTLHFIDPSSVTDALPVAGSGASFARDRRAERLNLADFPTRLAETSGGLTRTGSFDVKGVLGAVQAWYRVGIRVEGVRKDKAYAVSVSSSRSGISVRSQSAFLPRGAMTPEVAAALETKKAERLTRQARADARRTGPARLVATLGVRIEWKGDAGPDPGKPGRHLYRVDVRVPTADLTFTPQDEKMIASFRIALEAAGTGTNTNAGGASAELAPTLSGAEYSAALDGDQVHTFQLSLPAGPYRLTASVNDFLEERSGLARLEVVAEK